MPPAAPNTQPGLSDRLPQMPVGFGGRFDVRNFGAKGDGVTIDSDAINRAIENAAVVGGGIVVLSAGVYPSYSIRLRSHVGLHLERGAVLVAADTGGGRGYDPAERGPGNAYQDFGHSHWHNSLIWGENVEDVSITGPGRIDGKGLSRGLGGRAEDLDTRPGQANQAIALKLSRSVLLRDFTIHRGGHMSILLTGVDNVTIDNLTIDTNRDGIDVDACRNVRIWYRGGLSLETAATQPASLVNTFFRPPGGMGPREAYAVPEREAMYPEPSLFGVLPAYGFFVRHAADIRMDGVEVGFISSDTRPAFVLDDVRGIELHGVRAPTAPNVPAFVLRDVEEFRVTHSAPLRDTYVKRAARQSF